MRVRIMLQDTTHYDPELCETGGRYLYRTFFVREGDGVWRVSYWCSADFPFCPHSGRFEECREDCKYEYVSYWGMLKRLPKEFSPYLKGEIQVQFFLAGEWITLRNFWVRDELPDSEENFLKKILALAQIYLQTLAKYEANAGEVSEV